MVPICDGIISRALIWWGQTWENQKWLARTLKTSISPVLIFLAAILVWPNSPVRNWLTSEPREQIFQAPPGQTETSVRKAPLEVVNNRTDKQDTKIRIVHHKSYLLWKLVSTTLKNFFIKNSLSRLTGAGRYLRMRLRDKLTETTRITFWTFLDTWNQHS